MIANVPDPEEMKQLAIRAYFVAWREATSIIDPQGLEPTGLIAFEFKNDKLVAVAAEEYSLEKHESEANLTDYERLMQTKLQLVYSLIQHSQELALKSILCEKSPFLLLLGSDIKSWTRENGDFMDFKTIDASDLTKVVSVVCDLRLSESFKNTIEQVRRGRNAIQHLGKHKGTIELLDPIRILTQQYLEIFPGRNWLKDFLAAEGTGLDQLFPYDDFTSKTGVLHQLSLLHLFTTKNTAKRVLGVAENSTLYNCEECISDAKYEDTGHDITKLGSVERKRGALIARCRLCDTAYELEQKRCKECGCDVIEAASGTCFACKN